MNLNISWFEEEVAFIALITQFNFTTSTINDKTNFNYWELKNIVAKLYSVRCMYV